MRLDTIKKDLRRALSKATDEAARAFFLRHLASLDASGLDLAAADADIDRILRDVKKTFGRSLEQLADEPYATAFSAAYGLGANKIAEDFGFDDKDKDTLDTLRDYSTWWVRDQISQDIIDALKENLKNAVDNGWTRAQLAAAMKKSLKGVVKESQLYWEVTADHMLSKVQSMGQVAGYTRARISMVKVVAVLDNRTTAICRHMHGRLIEVSALQTQYDEIVEASKVRDLKASKDAVKRAQRLVTAESFGSISRTYRTRDLVDTYGLRLPPYHWRCRTVTVAYFPPDDPPRFRDDFGARANRDILTSLTDAEIHEWVKDLRRKARSGALPYNDTDARDDKKHWRELGANNADDYEHKCREIVGKGDRVALSFYKKGREMQTMFSDGTSVVICDKWSMRYGGQPAASEYPFFFGQGRRLE